MMERNFPVMRTVSKTFSEFLIYRNRNRSEERCELSILFILFISLYSMSLQFFKCLLYRIQNRVYPMFTLFYLVNLVA